MYDISKLEEEWKRYNRKKRRPLYLISGLSLLITGIIFYAYKNNYFDLLNSQPNEEVKTDVVVTAEMNNTVVQKEKKVISKENTESNQTIQFEFVTKESAAQPYDRATVEPVLEDSILMDHSKNVGDDSKDKLDVGIVDTSNMAAYKEVETRFYETQESSDALFLAQTYLKKGDYKKAEYWALQTNKVDDSIEQAWLIFAEAKYKQGQKRDAIKVLEAYIIRSDSIQAKRLLGRIR